MQKKIVIGDKDVVENSISDICTSILENHTDLRSLIFIGIRTRGEYLAQRLRDGIASREGVEIPMGVLDISFYRDDTRGRLVQPVVKGTDIPFDIEGKAIVLIDDVLYTGRSVRAAIDELMDFGRPGRIELAILVDRGHRELPIFADYVGVSVKTESSDVIEVKLHEYDGYDEIHKLII